MEIFFILSLVVIVILLVGYPLVNPRKYQLQTASPAFVGADNDLYGKREIVFEALRDLQFEYATGKLSNSDYEQLKSTYELQAAEILRQIDALPASKGKNGQTARVCHRCRATMNTQDKFCTKCGAKL